MSQPLRVDRSDDGVVLLTLALPERRNAMTVELTEAWTAAMTSLAADRSARAVVVTGEGRAFCSGGDLAWIDPRGDDAGTAELREKMAPFYRSWLRIRSLDVPTIAAVNGPAVGAGLCLALACDLRYAAPEARFSVPFTRLGMHPGMAATYLLTEAVGRIRARELLFTGRTVEPAEAAAIGLVNGVSEPGAAVGAALEVARTIASAAPVATRLTKIAMRDGARDFEATLGWEGLAQAVTLAEGEAAEGISAQLERRAPSFAAIR